MRLAPMRFKEFTWPHNPEVYTVEYRRRIAVHPAPFGPCVMQELGSSYRVLKGEGVFVGEGAYQRFQELAGVFQQEGPGLLVHPVWKAERAYFAALEAMEPGNGGGPGGASPAGRDSGNQRVHTVRKGDTLWAVAKQYGVELAALVRANPQIKNPNLIYPGEAVKVP